MRDFTTSSITGPSFSIPAAKCGDLEQLKLQNINSKAANYSEMKYSEYSIVAFVLHEHPEVVIS